VWYLPSLLMLALEAVSHASLLRGNQGTKNQHRKHSACSPTPHLQCATCVVLLLTEQDGTILPSLSLFEFVCPSDSGASVMPICVVSIINSATSSNFGSLH